MFRIIKAVITDSASRDFDVIEQDVMLLKPDIVVEDYGDEVTFRIIEKVSDVQLKIKIDLAKCKTYMIEKPLEDISLYWLVKASFLDIIRLGAK